MKKQTSLIRQTSKRNRMPFHALLLGLLLTGWAMIACLPTSYSLQVSGLKDCDGSSIAGGKIDVSVRREYSLTVSLSNWLAVSGNPNTFVPETNYIEINEMKVWYTYPKTFGIPETDALYSTEDNARVQEFYARVEPSVVGGFDLIIVNAGQSATTTVNSVDIKNLPVVAVETASLWTTAPELKITAGSQVFPYFTVTANIQFFGLSGTGAKLSTPIIKYPILVCNGCLDNSKGTNANCASSGASTSCVGQDNACLEQTTTEDP